MKGPPAPIDPRTVPRARMLDRLGARRPEISVIAFFEASPGEAFSSWQALAGQGTTSSQLIFGYGRGVEPPPGRPGALSQRADETLIEFANRASALGLGHLIALLPPGADGGSELPLLIERFAGDLRLGALGFRAGPDGALGLIAREGLWTALGGFEASFVSWAWAIQDFCLRARAIGYGAPVHPAAADCRHPDARLFEERAALAPDRSASPLSAEGPTPRFTVYTAITDNYDTLKPQPPQAMAGCEQVAFLDPATAAAYGGHSRGWRIASFDAPAADAHRAARFPKINAHRALPESDYSLWIDASIGIVCPFPLLRLGDLFLGDHDICVFRHHARRSAYEEAEACIAYGLDEPAVIESQIARYRREGLPATTGLAEAPILLRRHTPAVQSFNEAWWSEICRGSRRDQLSFNYVAWKQGLRYATFPLSLATGNGLFVKFIR